MRRLALLCACLLLGGSLNNLSAQKYEIDPYAGGFFPGKFLDVLHVNKSGIYGVKAGVFVTRSIEAEGHFGYVNDLSFQDTLTRKRAYIWEAGGSYQRGGSHKFYGTFGIGGVTTSISADSRDFFDPAVLTRDRFLSLSYGGGMKVLRKWGPMGYRVDVRGRTLPHYYGFQFNWLEATAGLTFSWGER